jgi:hypothetical protein
MELLRARFNMVELQSPKPTRVAAEDTCPARLLDELALDGPAALGHRGGTAAFAAVVATTLEDELRYAVPAALECRES